MFLNYNRFLIYNRLFDPNCELTFFKYQWLLTPQLSCLSQHTGEIIIMSVKTHCRSSLIRANIFIKDLNLFFSKKKQSDQGEHFLKDVGFCPPCQIKQWAFVQWDIVQWAIVLVGFCPSGLLSVPLPWQLMANKQTTKKLWKFMKCHRFLPLIPWKFSGFHGTMP